MYNSYRRRYRQLPGKLSLILVGKADSGKSETGNSIIMGKDHFKASVYPSSEKCEYDGCEITVVDFPDIFYTHSTNEEKTEKFSASMQNVLLENTDGYHAFLFVLKLETPFTKEEEKMFKFLKANLGSDFIKNYGIIVLTIGENDKTQRHLDIASICVQQTDKFKKLLKECNKRHVVFNNYASENDKKIDQRDKLLDIVIKLNNEEKTYTIRHFRDLKNEFKPSENIAMSKVPINTQKPERTELNQTVGTMKSNQTISTIGTEMQMQKSEIEVHTLDTKSPISETMRATAHDKMIHERQHTETTERKSSDDKKKRVAYPELDLILIGKSGSGKSATGNSILRQQEFKAHCKADSDVRFPQYRATIIGGRNVQVVECPGIIDTDIDKQGGVERVVRAIQNAVLANPEGYHAFLIVVAFGQRFYKQELDCIKILKHIFGQNVIKTHGIIVLSYGDTFKHHEVKEEVTIEKYCENQTGPLKELLMECNNRVVVFDNLTENDDIKNEQLINLIKKIDLLKSCRQISPVFKKAITLTSTLQTEKKMIIHQNLILQEILDAKNKENWSDILNNIINVIKEHLNEINKKLETKEILGLLKFNMVETIRHIQYCASTYKMSDELFKEVEIEFKKIKLRSDEGFFHKCLHQLEENDCQLEDCVNHAKLILRNYTAH